jgi:hypothetical protein
MQINAVALHDCIMPPVSDRKEHQPGARAPATGRYEELNVFGSPTGRIERVREGEPLPASPRGHSWRPIEEGC